MASLSKTLTPALDNLYAVWDRDDAHTGVQRFVCLAKDPSHYFFKVWVFLRRPQNLKISSLYFWQERRVLWAQQRTCQKVDEDFQREIWTSRVIQTLCILDPNNNKLLFCGIIKHHCQSGITHWFWSYSSRCNTYFFLKASSLSFLFHPQIYHYFLKILQVNFSSFLIKSIQNFKPINQMEVFEFRINFLKIHSEL